MIELEGDVPVRICWERGQGIASALALALKLNA